MKEHQAQSDRDWEQAALDHKRAVHEQEVLKYNNLLQTQIATLQRAQEQTRLESEPKIRDQTDGSITVF